MSVIPASVARAPTYGSRVAFGAVSPWYVPHFRHVVPGNTLLRVRTRQSNNVRGHDPKFHFRQSHVYPIMRADLSRDVTCRRALHPTQDCTQIHRDRKGLASSPSFHWIELLIGHVRGPSAFVCRRSPSFSLRKHSQTTFRFVFTILQTFSRQFIFAHPRIVLRRFPPARPPFTKNSWWHSTRTAGYGGWLCYDTCLWNVLRMGHVQIAIRSAQQPILRTCGQWASSFFCRPHKTNCQIYSNWSERTNWHHCSCSLKLPLCYAVARALLSRGGPRRYGLHFSEPPTPRKYGANWYSHIYIFIYVPNRTDMTVVASRAATSKRHAHS